jgi:hypothetical protein
MDFEGYRLVFFCFQAGRVSTERINVQPTQWDSEVRIDVEEFDTKRKQYGSRLKIETGSRCRNGHGYQSGLSLCIPSGDSERVDRQSNRVCDFGMFILRRYITWVVYGYQAMFFPQHACQLVTSALVRILPVHRLRAVNEPFQTYRYPPGSI